MLLLPRLHHVASECYGLIDPPLILKGSCNDAIHNLQLRVIASHRSQDANDDVVDHTIFNRELPCSHYKEFY